MSVPDAGFDEAGFEEAGFDEYEASYPELVQDSINFSGLSYDFFLRSKAGLLNELVDANFADLKHPPSLLDVGCGVGALHPLLRPQFREIHGVDVSGESIARARRDNPRCSYAAYGGPRLPVRDGRFDVVLAVCVLHHVPPQDWAVFVSELRRAARPGGLVCVIEHNPLNPATRLSVMRCPFDRDAVLLRRPKTEALLRDAGLADVRSRYFVFLPSLAPWARRLERRLARVPFGAQYVSMGRA